MKLLDLLKSLAKKAGVNVETDPTFKALTENDVIKDFDLDDNGFANPLEQKLLTEDSATVNPTVKSKLFAQALNGAEAELNGFLSDFELDDSFKTTYNSIERNTNERIRKLRDALKTKVDAIKKSKPTDNDSKQQIQALENKIKDLNLAAANFKQMHETELSNMKLQNLNDKKGYMLKSVLAGKPLPKNGLKPEINIQLAKTLLEDDMAKKNLIITFDESGNAVLKEKKDGAESVYYVNNHPVNLDSFIDGVLAQNNFVQLNDQDGGDSGQNGPDNNQFSQNNGNKGQLRNIDIANNAMSKVKQVLSLNNNTPSTV
jgi:hypothetical protein